MFNLGSLLGHMGGAETQLPEPPDSDSRMISRSLASLSAQASELKKRMECHGTPLPSWAEYKVYKAHDAIKDALSSTFGGSPGDRGNPLKTKHMVVVIRKAKKLGTNEALANAGLPPKAVDAVVKRANQALVQQGLSRGLTPEAANAEAYPPSNMQPPPVFTGNPAIPKGN